MTFALLLVAAAAAAEVRPASAWPRDAVLAVNDEAAGIHEESAAAKASPGKIAHAPVERSPRGEAVVIRAKIDDPSRLFAPLVFARKSGVARYEAFTMRDRGVRRGFEARLPASMLSEGSFEYFIEAQHEAEGVASRAGSPRSPYSCAAYDPPPEPVAVTVRTPIPGVPVRIDDKDYGTTPVTVKLLPGRHTVALTNANGRTAEQQIDVRPGRKVDLPMEFARQPGDPGTLAVFSDPSEANVLVDGTFVGRTPYQGTLGTGEHTVAVELEGRMREQRKVLARDGRDATLSFALAPLPKTPAVSVESDPVGAVVLVDGKERGRTPLIVALPPGLHQVILRHEGRREVSTDFDMPVDRDLSIRLDLPFAAGSGSRLTVSSTPSGATVSLDGNELGVTPWSAEARPGTHRVSVSGAGFVREERSVQILHNRDTDLAFALQRSGPARLQVESEPPAMVRVDGKELGTSPLSAEVEPGDHQLEIVLEGFKTVAQQVTVSAGQGVSVRVPMQKAQNQSPPLIAVSSDPAGAQIHLDGKLVGATPLKLRTTPGQHEVRLSLEGYVPRVTRPNLPPDRDFELRIAVVLTPVRGGGQQQHAPTSNELFQAQVAAAHACSVKGDLECALSGYQTAYGYRPNPRVLFNIAQLRRKLGKYSEAAATYRQFLAAAEKPKSGAQQKELIAEAKIQLAACQNKLVPALAAAPAAAPAPEDTVAPRLTHEPVRHTLRGNPVQILADITDDRSGVGPARACWRNAYDRDFECHPMGNVGGDRYGVEVPARAVTDNFAYYLEAWDNAENGPTRSGAPEMPHAVTIDDPAGVTPSVEVRPPEPGLAIGAAYHLGGAPGAGALPPAVSPPPAPAAQGFARPRGEMPWTFTALLGGERSNEQTYTDSVTRGRIGVEASRWYSGNWFFTGNFDWRSYTQQYIPFNGAPSVKVTTDEDRFDLGAAAGYDVGALLVKSGSLELVPLLGLQYIGVKNTGFGFNVFGPSAGLRASWRFLSRFVVRGVTAFTWNANQDSTGASAFASPDWALSGRAGLQVLLTPAYAIELDYVGDGIRFQNVSRVAHGAVFGFSTNF